MSKLSLGTAWYQTVQQAAHALNFKGGAFKGVITKDTKTVDALDIFISSPLLSESEKSRLRKARSILSEYYQQNEWTSLSDVEILMRSLPMWEAAEVFKEDMKRRGQYVPPTLLHTETRSVTRTYTCDSDGNATETPGGILGAIPGAPPGFNAASTKHMADLGLGKKKEKKQHGSVKKGNGKDNHRNRANDSDKKESKTSLEKEEKDTKPNAKAEHNDTKGGFGADFNANIRRAFR